MIGSLPAHSHYVSTRLDDPEYAEWAASQPPAPPTPPPLSEWTPEVARLTDVVDLLNQVTSVLIGTATGKRPPEAPHARRPVTGVDRMKAARSRRRHESLVDEVKQAQERWQQQQQQQEGRAPDG